jgi:hypothetical protein
MDKTIIFNAQNQENIAGVAAELSTTLEPSLPRVPWLSNSGQKEAFNKIVQLVVDATGKLSADEDAKNAVIFWTLTLLYANKKPVRLATASVKNWGVIGVPAVASSWVSWIGGNSHPGQIVSSSYQSWRQKSYA